MPYFPRPLGLASLLALALSGASLLGQAATMPALDGMIEEQHDRFQFPRVKAWKYSNFHSAPLEERDNHAFPAWQLLSL